MRPIFLVRLCALAATVACALAVVVARTAPRPAQFRLRSDAQYVAINGLFFSLSAQEPCVLDTARGTLLPLRLPAGEKLDWVSFSPWLDDADEREIVGRWTTEHGSGLARFSYPSGRVLDQLPDAPLPRCAPCWYPGSAPRVVYAAADGRLYQCSFQEAGAPRSGPPEVKPIAWPNPPAALHVPVFESVVWPKIPSLRGCLVAAVGSAGPPACYRPAHLWWLRLSPDGTRIVEAGPLSPGDALPPSVSGEYTPSVTALPDGRCLVAYQRRVDSVQQGELFVVPLRTDRDTGAPSIRPAEARKLGDTMVRAPAYFSPDGTSVYVLHGRPGDAPAIRRLSALDGDS